MASTISAARSALYTLLAAHSYPGATPQITFGQPAAYEEQEVVALMGVESPDEEPAVIGGPNPREETYRLIVAVKAHDPAADTALTVDARCFVLMDEVREVVYANPKLSASLGAGLGARVESQTTDGALPAEGGGWVMFGKVAVLCNSRIA